MADPTRNESAADASSLAGAARERGMEHIEGAKGQLAEGAERVAAAMDRTADELEGDGDSTLSGYGHSLAGLMRQLAGGLRERDIEQFASELGTLARRNPGVFLAGSVALGFGVSRFFKARSPQRSSYDGSSYYDGERDYDAPERYGREQAYDGHDRAYQGTEHSGQRYDESESTFSAQSATAVDRGELDADETLDLSRNPTAIDRREDDTASRAEDSDSSGTAQPSMAARGDAQKPRSTGKSRAKSQRASTDSEGNQTTTDEDGGSQS